MIPAISTVLALGLLAAAPNSQPPALRDPEPPDLTQRRFLVECHCFIPAADGLTEDYGYELNAFGYAQPQPNGIEIQLDERQIRFSVKQRPALEGEYEVIHAAIPLVQRPGQNCVDGGCDRVDLVSESVLEDALRITYDQDRGRMFVEHRLSDEVVLRGRGGCLFVALPPAP
ncbi:MAG: hypothetical protein HC910_05460 [Spirulinaceae cyanobacterium SM2_1_0]|nr:hypothetical protein [Spirulinaceae cyanobacterium SM2_1_0]